MSGKGGLNIGVPDDTSSDFIIPEGAPEWFIKIGGWMRFRKSCQLKAGPIGAYCRWMGSSCAYNSCPARIFEEIEIGLYPEGKVPEKVKDRVRRVDEDLKKLTIRVDGVATNQKKSSKKLRDELKEIKELLEKSLA